MPIYEYLCEQCGKRSEVLQKLSDAPLSICEECGGPLRKLVSAPSFQFKGSGWYVTDYAKSGKDDKGDKGDKPSSSGDGKAEGGSEAKSDKPDGKSESKDSATKSESSPAPTPSTSAPSASAPSSSSSSSGDS